MKTSKTAKALVSVALVIAMLLSMCIVGFTGVSAAGLNLNYEFAYKNAGYAEGRMSLSGTSGTYILYWADDTAALKGYAGIAQITVNSGTKYFEMPANTAIPAGATKVIAVDSSKTATVANASAVFEIPADKQFKGGTKQYDFMSLSDIHIEYGSFYQFAEEHLANSLEVAAKRDVEFIATCGDNMNGNNGTNTYLNEWYTYLKILASSNYNNPIYEANGNHETYADDGKTSDPYDFGLNLFKQATGLNASTGKVQDAPYFEKTINGDHYIFMTMELITKNQHPGISDCFSSAQLDWLENLLNKYKNDGHKIFIYEHAPFKNYGAGDNKVTPYYTAAMVDTYPNVKRFKNLLEANKDVITFSGHTHIDFKYGYNFDNENGTTAYTVHIPSNASTTHPKAGGGGLDYIHDINSSQGYLVDVYEDYVILNGTDLAFNLICPSYVYMVDYTGEELVENEMEDIVFDTVTVTVDVSAITDAPVGVDCIAINQNNTASKQIPMTKNADGTYSAKVSTEFASMKFIVNCGTGDYTSSVYNVANCKVVLGGVKVRVNLADITTKTGGSCTSWSTVNTYAWNSATNANCGVWPGTEMTKMADGTYVALLADGVNPDMIIFSSGSNQTADLEIDPYIVEIIEGSYTVDGDVTEPETQPTEKPTQAPTQKPTSPVVTEPTEKPTNPVVTEPSEVPTTPSTTPTESKPSTDPTEPEKDALAPIVIVEETDDSYFLVDAYAADGAKDVEFKFAVNGRVIQDYSDISTFVFGVAGDGRYILEVTAKYADGSEHKTTVMVEIKDGEAILPEMPERPTEPTVPTEPTTTPDESKPTDPATSEAPTEPDVEYLYGDADLNGKVNIKDATQIQKYAAKILDLDDVAYIQADVTGDTKVNIKDATSIQKWVAKIFDKFPVEEGTELAAVGANVPVVAVGALKDDVKTALSKEYQYASYDAYMALKKAYMTNASNLQQAFDNYNTMKSKNSLANPGGTANIGDINIGATGQGSPALPGPSFGGGSTGGNTGDNTGGNTGGDVTTDMISIYFVKPSDWENAYIYAYYGNGTNMDTEWSDPYPGNKMTFVETDANGNDIYVSEVPADINTIKFADGSATNRRTDIIVDFADDVCYKLGATFGTNKWYVEKYDYTADGGNTDDNTGGNSGGNTGGNTDGTWTVYFSNTNNWGTVYAHLFGTGGDKATWPGTAMTDTGKTSDSGKKLYSITFDTSKYQSVVFNSGNGGEQTIDITIGADATVYYLESTKDSQGHYNVGSYDYSSKY